MNWICFLDAVSAVCTIVCLWNAKNHRNWWLVYAMGTVLFTVLMIIKGLPGMTLMGLALIATGLKNYKQK